MELLGNERFINADYLITNPTHIFVFGDNELHEGLGGAAANRNFPNSYGFVTKKFPGGADTDYYRPDEYEKVFYEEVRKLEAFIVSKPQFHFLISRLGAGLADRFGIYEEIIMPKIRRLLGVHSNVEFLWDDDSMKLWWGRTDLNGRLSVFEYQQIDEKEDRNYLAAKQDKELSGEVFAPIAASTKNDAVEVFNLKLKELATNVEDPLHQQGRADLISER